MYQCETNHSGPPHERHVESTVLESAWLSSARPTNMKTLSLEGTDDEEASTTAPFLVRGGENKKGVWGQRMWATFG